MLLFIATAALGKPPPNRAYPDTADRNTLITLRDGVRGDSRTMLRTIGRCERSVPDPYGADRTAFDQCISTLLHQDLYKSRFEPAMLVGVLRDLAPGACAGLASGVMEAISELGNEADTWIADVESGDPSAGALERADAHDMRSIAHESVALTISRRWKTACRPRAYQPSEHYTRRANRRYDVRSFTLVS